MSIRVWRPACGWCWRTTGRVEPRLSCVRSSTRNRQARAGNVMRLSGPTFEISLRSSNLAELQKVLADQQPAIVFLKTGSLAYWSMDIFHTAVLIGLDATTVALNDPYFATAPQTISLQSFEKSWAETAQFAALLRPR